MSAPQHDEYDWISVGSGAAGLASALAAAIQGHRTLLVEKSNQLGGQTAYSYGSLYGPVDSLSPGPDFEPQVRAAEVYLRWLSGGFLDESRVSRLCADAAPALSF